MSAPSIFDSSDSRRLVRRSALRLTFVYLALGLLWILLTDWLLAGLISDPQRLTFFQSLKGIAYVLLSAVLVFVLAYRGFRAFSRMASTDRNLRMVLDTVPTRVAWKGVDGRYLGCNRRFLEDAGLEDPSEIVGRTDAELPWSEQAEEIRKEDRSVVESGRAALDRRGGRTDARGQTRWIRISRVPLTDPSGVVGILVCYEDETERTVAEAQLRQAQKIHEIGQLTSGVAHDFKNILSVILANADLVASGTLDHESEREALSDIRNAARTASGSVEKLLGFARKADLSPAPMQVGPVVQALQPMLSRLLMSEFPISVEVDGDLPIVRADPDALDQMLLNLVTNARDAMEPGRGEIRITVRETRVTDGIDLRKGTGTGGRERETTDPPGQAPLAPGRYVVIAVSDQGEGIDPGILDRVCEPFFTTKARGVGTGLGLSMVLGLMQQQGGGVRIRSRRGVGTTVQLFFPVPKEERVSEASGATPPVPGKGTGRSGTILVVDDQAALRRTIARALELVGYEVRVAGDGTSALEAARRDPEGLDLILSDLTMPGLSGLELFRALREEGIRVPFALTTGRTALLEEATSDAERSLMVLHKPWTIDQLTDAVDRLVRP